MVLLKTFFPNMDKTSNKIEWYILCDRTLACILPYTQNVKAKKEGMNRSVCLQTVKYI